MIFFFAAAEVLPSNPCAAGLPAQGAYYLYLLFLIEKHAAPAG